MRRGGGCFVPRRPGNAGHVPLVCPHCRTTVDGDETPWPPTPTRCAACALVIGAGRAVLVDGEDARARSHSSAAGTLAARARREARLDDGPPASPESIERSLTSVAEVVGTPVARLRMLDYESASLEGLVPLQAIIARHGSWKTARAAVAAAAGRDGD